MERGNDNAATFSDAMDALQTVRDEWASSAATAHDRLVVEMAANALCATGNVLSTAYADVCNLNAIVKQHDRGQYASELGERAEQRLRDAMAALGPRTTT